MKQTFVYLLLIIFLIFSISVVSAQSIGVIDYQVTLYEGEKVSIQNTTKELYLENVDASGLITFYVESNIARLRIDESKTLDGVNISVVDVSFTNKYATFRIQAEITPPEPPIYQELSPEHVADKIVTHGYALIDAYIKELPGYTCTFPNGKFTFLLEQNDMIDISPACTVGFVWRTISFSRSTGETQAIFLDGPINNTPGTPNEEAIESAKNTLTKFLSDNNMMVKSILKEDIRLNLSSVNDFQIFIDLMFNSIKISTPLATEEPTSVTLPEGTSVKLSPIDKERIQISGLSSSLKQIETEIDLKHKEKKIKINVDEAKKKLEIEIDKITAVTNKSIKIENSKLYIETSVGYQEIKISPKEASSKAREITTLKKIEVKEESQKPIYSVKGTREAKLLFIIPVSMEIEIKVDVETGNVISINKPWWSFLAW